MNKYMKKIQAASLVVIAMAALTACETTFYDEEQYRKEIYIVSDDNNMFGQEYSFDDNSVGYISIYAGGTTPIEKDVQVELEVYSDYLRQYNQRVYGDNYASYAQELDPEDYTFESMTATLKAGSENPYVMLPVKVNVKKLLTQEKYYIPLRIKSVSDYMISTKKREVLYRVYIKNDYATTKTTTYYSMQGTEQQKTYSGGEWVDYDALQPVNSTKVFTPISERSIRMLPGTSYSTDNTVVTNQSLTVTVHPDEWIDVPVYVEGLPTGEFIKRQKVTLATWIESSSSVVVEDVEDQLNYYDPETQTFTLNYRYMLPGGNWHFMNEVLKPLSITNK